VSRPRTTWVTLATRTRPAGLSPAGSGTARRARGGSRMRSFSLCSPRRAAEDSGNRRPERHPSRPTGRAAQLPPRIAGSAGSGSPPETVGGDPALGRHATVHVQIETSRHNLGRAESRECSLAMKAFAEMVKWNVVSATGDRVATG